MNAQTSRRALLRGQVNEVAIPRPPGAPGDIAFHDSCTQCGDCARACPEGIILRDKSGLPALSFTEGECTFCNACITACEPGVLSADRPWPWAAEVAGSCLSAQGVHCRTCQDFCDARAIRFQLTPGGMADMTLDRAACTGCGACLAPCPVGAITLTHIQPVQTNSDTEARPC